MARDEGAQRRALPRPQGEALLKAMFDAADVIAGVFELLEDDYRYVTANRNAAAFYGKPPGGLDGLCGRDLGLTPEQIQVRMATLRHCWASGETQTQEYPFRLPNGRSGWFLGTFSPIRGERPWVSFVVLDITERRLAQMEAQRQGDRLALALEAADLGLWEYDLAADVVDWDGRMRTLFGVPADKPIDFATYAAAVHPEDFPAVEAAFRRAVAGENDGGYVVEHRIAPGEVGGVRWIRGAARVVFGKDGKPRRVIGTAQDVTGEVEARERQDLLLAELNHRVKNNLAAVQAIAQQTLRATGRDPEAFRKGFEERLMSLALGHDLLTRNAWSMAPLEEVLEAALTPFAGQAIRVSGGPAGVRVKPELAVNLVMILNELATNAAKYGALSVPAGAVSLEWTASAEGLSAIWREQGGPPVAPPAREGFGMRMKRRALTPFGGKVEVAFEPTGLVCRLSVPLTAEP
ncbi:MAG: sensor histidine kinase [Phenylobacterium sp.]|uniref:sensor histidine kinase n=1 Tax=Phenylobacterium sp. TaxID=1871053 RepID=UPI00391B8CC8